MQGPLIYAVVHVAGTLLFWRTSPVALIALAVLCGGDGAAEPVGVAYGRIRCGLEGPASISTNVDQAQVTFMSKQPLPPVDLLFIDVADDASWNTLADCPTTRQKAMPGLSHA